MTFRKYFPIIIWLIISVILLNFSIVSVFSLKNNISLMISEKNTQKLLKEKTAYFRDFQENEEFYNDIFNKINNQFNSNFKEIRENHNLTLGISSAEIGFNNDDFWPNEGINLSLKGSYSDFLNFLREIEKKPIEIVHLEIHRAEEGISALIILKKFSNQL